MKQIKDLPNQDGFMFRAITVAGYIFPAVVKLDSDGIHRVYLTKRDDNGDVYIANPVTAKIDISTLIGWFPLSK